MRRTPFKFTISNTRCNRYHWCLCSSNSYALSDYKLLAKNHKIVKSELLLHVLNSLNHVPKRVYNKKLLQNVS